MNHDVWWTWDVIIFIPSHVKMRCHGVENLSRIREVRFERVDIGRLLWERHQIQIQDSMSFAHKVRNDMATCFTTSSREYLRWFVSEKMENGECGVVPHGISESTYDSFSCWSWWSHDEIVSSSTRQENAWENLVGTSGDSSSHLYILTYLIGPLIKMIELVVDYVSETDEYPG